MKHFLLTLAFALIAVVGISQLTQIKVGANPGDTTATSNSIDSASFVWIDAAHVTATLGDGSKVEFADTPGINAGGTQNFLSETPSTFFGGNCSAGGPTGQSTLFARNYSTGSGQVDWKYLQPAHGNCTETGFHDIAGGIGDKGNANILFHWNSTNNDLEDVSDGNNKFTRASATSPGDNVYISGGNTCGQASGGVPTLYIVIDSNDNATLWALTSGNEGLPGSKQIPQSESSTDAVGCYVSDLTNSGPLHHNSDGSYNVHITGIKYITVAASSGTVDCGQGTTAKSVAQCPGSSSASTSPSGLTNTCPSSSLSWLICPIADAMSTTVNNLNGFIQGNSSSCSGSNAGLFCVDVNQYFSDKCANGASSSEESGSCSSSNINYQFWGNIRDLALSLLVIVALIMVISTALDVGPFDAYTVKKILPRILISVILVSFSWELGRFLVGVSNDLGLGVKSLITSVLPGSINLGAIVANALGWFGAAGVGGVVLLAAVGPLSLVMLLLPTLIAFLLGFLVLAARQLIIIACVIFAPIAFIAFVLPGTQGVWKFWQKSFAGALFLFPLVTGAIGLGELMAYLVSPSYANATPNYAGIAPLLALIFIIAPYFLIPRIFRMSNGMLGTVANGINSASQGLFKAAKQAQRNKMASSWEKAKKGDLYHGYSWLPGSQRLSNRVSGVTRAAGTGWSGHYGIGERGRQAIHKTDNSAVEEYMRSPENAAFKDYDDAQRAKTYANATEAAEGLRNDWGLGEKEIHQAIEAARVSGGFGGYQAVAAARNLAMSTTAYKDVDLQRADGTVEHRTALEQAVETINRVSRDNGGINAGLSAFTSAAAKAQRPDISPGAEAMIGLGQERMKLGKPLGKKIIGEHLDKAFKGAGSVQQMMAYAKKPAIESFMNRQIDLLKSGDRAERAQAALHINEMASNLSSAGGDQRDAVLERLAAAKFDIGGEGVPLSTQLIARANGDQPGETGLLNGVELNESSLATATRSWGSGDQAAAQAAQNAAGAAGAEGGVPTPPGQPGPPPPAGGA